MAEIPDTYKSRLRALFIKERDHLIKMTGTSVADTYIDWEDYQNWLEEKLINFVKIMEDIGAQFKEIKNLI